VPNAGRLDRPLAVEHADETLGLLGERSPPPSELEAKPAEGQPHGGPAGRADSCKDAEQRLARPRMDPKQEEVDRFARDLACEALRPQVLRLLESLGTFPAATPPPATALVTRPPTQQSEGTLATRPPRSGIAGPQLQTDVEQNKMRRKKGYQRDAEPDGEDTCRRNEATLARLRAAPDRDEVISFARNLACEQLRPQVARLLESVAD
jgi:hypothetical protein